MQAYATGQRAQIIAGKARLSPERLAHDRCVRKGTQRGVPDWPSILECTEANVAAYYRLPESER